MSSVCSLEPEKGASVSFVSEDSLCRTFERRVRGLVASESVGNARGSYHTIGMRFQRALQIFQLMVT